MKQLFLFLFLTTLFSTAAAFAIHEIQIDQVSLQEPSAERYDISASVANLTDNSREVTLRAQIFFFEKASPKGDKPAMILRKDETLILNEHETRKIQIRLLNEGTLPKGRLRAEPEVRLRRQRVWNY